MRLRVRLRNLAILITVACLSGIAARSTVTAQAPASSGPPLETPDALLAAALHCPSSLRGLDRDPVLLVHGTGADAPASWSWNYAIALPNVGFAVCYVDLPDFALVDIQESSEYVVAAIRTMNRQSGRRVAVIGHSQGGLQPRWAMRWWPDIRSLVSDSISLASTQHGTTLIDAAMLCAAGCAPSIWQQRPDSRLLAALNSGDETFAGVDYTALGSAADMVVMPQPAASALRASVGARVSNVLLQDICPDDTASHSGILGDAVAFALVVDALSNDGPADPARIDRAVVCAQPAMPGGAPSSAEAVEAWAALATIPTGARIAAYPPAAAEPPLKSYAR